MSKKLGVRGYAKGVSLQTTVKTNPDSLDVPDGLRCNMQPSPDLWQKVPGYSSDDEAAATWEYRLLEYQLWFETDRNQPALLVDFGSMVPCFKDAGCGTPEPTTHQLEGRLTEVWLRSHGPWMMIVGPPWKVLASLSSRYSDRPTIQPQTQLLFCFFGPQVPSWRNFCIFLSFFPSGVQGVKARNVCTDL